MREAILAIDQGTTRTKAAVFDSGLRPLADASIDVPLYLPRPGWVEQDPGLLLAGVMSVAAQAAAGVDCRIAAVGIDNQGETVVAWNRRSGEPVYNAIVWQDRRTERECEQIRASGVAELVAERTGLPIDPYFSATKLRWILDNVPAARALERRCDLLAGTTDAWFHWNLTGRHVTDHSTASRTMLYNPLTGDWDEEMLRIFGVPRGILPEIRSTVSDFGEVRGVLGASAAILASLVDQQASLCGQGCVRPGDLKVTYGTGAFLLQNIGDVFHRSAHGLVPTVAWRLNETSTYALDGGIYSAGAAVQWLRDGLGIVDDVADTQDLALSVPDTGGVVFVPALSGLAAPFWDSTARGTLLGISRGTGRAEIARATLEGVAFRTRDVVDAMAADTARPLSSIRVDGGASANAFLMQCLADVLNMEVHVAALPESTARGTAVMAAFGADLIPSLDVAAEVWEPGHVYQPAGTTSRDKEYERWCDAVNRSKGWALSG